GVRCRSCGGRRRPWLRTERRRWKWVVTDTSRSRARHAPWSPRCSASSGRTMVDEQESSARILIVDDHEDNAELLRARLESWGYETDSAMDGGQALEKVEASPPDLILLDVMMPHIDGMEVARREKSNTNLPFIPIIMQTARDTTEDKGDC